MADACAEDRKLARFGLIDRSGLGVSHPERIANMGGVFGGASPLRFFETYTRLPGAIVNDADNGQPGIRGCRDGRILSRWPSGF